MSEIFDPNWNFVLGQGSMYERLRRDPRIEGDPFIFHAALVYGETERDFMASILREYLDVGQKHRIPMLVVSPTWRANTERVAQSRCAGQPVNLDGAAFMRDVRDSYGPDPAPIVITGVIGPKGDAYKPEEALDRAAAQAFHTPQVEELAQGNLDCLEAKTLPALSEALGMADAMAATGQPYSLSFVVRPDGTILDGTPMDQVIDTIDNGVTHAPAFYMVNCVHASIYEKAWQAIHAKNPAATARMVGLEANTAALSPEELDALCEIAADTPENFGDDVWSLFDTTGARYLGGCCGSGTEHIEALADRAVAAGLGGKS